MTQCIVRDQFDGNALTTVKDGKVMFSNLTLDQYLGKEPGLKLVSIDEFNTLHRNYYSTPFTEITEERFDFALGELPPRRWHNIGKRFNVFFCGEAFSGDIHSLFLHDRQTGKYYRGKTSVFSNDTAIIEKFEREIVQNA